MIVAQIYFAEDPSRRWISYTAFFEETGRNIESRIFNIPNLFTKIKDVIIRRPTRVNLVGEEHTAAITRHVDRRCVHSA